MRSFAKCSVVALSLFSWTSPLRAVEPAKPHYILAMQIHDGERLAGSPKLKVSADELARIEIGEDKGHSYTLSVLISSKDDKAVYVKSDVNVTSGTQHYTATPKLLVGLNEDASITLGMAEKPIRIAFKVTATS